MTLGDRDERARAVRLRQRHLAQSAGDPLLHESPYSVASRPLVNEPLTADDWAEVHRAHRAFIMHVRMIVSQARLRVAH